MTGNAENKTEMNNASLRKKRMIICIAAVFGVLLVLSLAVFLMQNYSVKKSAEAAQTTLKVVFRLYPTDYDEDIYADTIYMGYDRNISYTNGALKIAITDGRYADYGSAVEFLAGYVNAIEQGDAEAYGECFSEEYLAVNKLPKKFTMQKLYNINITRVSETAVGEDAADSYMQYVYAVEYMIRMNNGTFRSDLESDALRPLYIEMSDKTGTIKIDGVSYFPPET